MRGYLRWGLILGVIALGLWAASHYLGEWWRKASAPRFLHAAVTRGRVENTVSSTGTVKAVQTVNVGSFVSGPIETVHVDFNDEVVPGQLLAEIDPRLLQAALDRDLAAVAREEAVVAREEANLVTQERDKARVEALLYQAKRNYGRGKELRGLEKDSGDFISEAELDQLEAQERSLAAQLKVAEASIRQASAAVKAARETLKQAKASLENSRTNREYCKIIAPPPRKEPGESNEQFARVKGRVIERKVDPGQTVAAAFQTPEMFVIAYRMGQKMHVHASVDEADIGHILAAQKQRKPVKFTVDAYPDEPFTGMILEVRRNSTTTQNVVTYPVVIEAPNPGERLFPGMTATISFEVEVREKVLRVPAAALRFVPPANRVRREDLKYLDALLQSDPGSKTSVSQKHEAHRARSRRVVWVDRDGMLSAVPVTLGMIDNQNAEVLEGALEEGDQLVTGVDTSSRR